MTGHQPHPGTGRTVMGEIVQKINIEQVLRGIGVTDVKTVNPLDLNSSVACVREMADKTGVKAIIFKSPCIAITKPAFSLHIDAEKCIGCKDCMQACPFGAIALLPYARDGRLVAQAMSSEPKVFASKCDLCEGIEGGPACVRVCPHQALRLVDPEAEREEKNIRAAEALLLTKNWR